MSADIKSDVIEELASASGANALTVASDRKLETVDLCASRVLTPDIPLLVLRAIAESSCNLTAESPKALVCRSLFVRGRREVADSELSIR